MIKLRAKVVPVRPMSPVLKEGVGVDAILSSFAERCRLTVVWRD